jgi:serine/threonine-protein kinase RsbW
MSGNAGKQFQLTVLNKLENIPLVAQFISDSMAQLGMDESKIFDVNVAVDEACTNIIQHAYSPEEQGTIEILCKLFSENKAAVLIKDYGKPFDQSRPVMPDTTSSLEERRPGGLGLFFMRELVDEIYYEYKDGYETLTMVKNLS